MKRILEERKMKKLIATGLAVVCAMSMVACGKSGAAEVYTAEVDSVEAGYEGDCVNTDQDILVLNADGTYTLTHGFYVNQISGVVVANIKNVYNGKYTAGEANEDGQKEITLEAPTSGYTNMNGSVTLSSDDPSVLEDFDATSFTVNVNTGAIEQ